MSLYMDVHTIAGGVNSADVAHAREADLQTQDGHGVQYLRYWVNEEQGKVLVEAPSADVATAVHKEANGLVADDIFRVAEGS